MRDSGFLIFDGGPGPCAEGSTINCYDGPIESIGHGPCTAGERACVGGVFSSACVGQVLPDGELCNETDDDCDGSTDEDFTLTDPLNCGACGNECHGSLRLCCSGTCMRTCP